MKQRPPRVEGRLVKDSVVQPTVEIDCSAWGNRTGSWTEGSLSKSTLTQSAMEVDCSDWNATPLSTLELTFHPDPAVSAVQLALELFDFIAAVDRAERSLGGSGMRKVDGHQHNGSVTLVLVPEMPDGAADRMRQICDAFNKASSIPTYNKPSGSLKSVEARIS